MAVVEEEEVERTPKIWKTVTMAVFLFLMGSVRLSPCPAVCLGPFWPFAHSLPLPLTLELHIPLPLSPFLQPGNNWHTSQLMTYYGVQALGEAGGYDRGVAMCTVGAIAFLPGSYATWHLYGAWRRWPGYTYDMVPSYDE